MSHVTTDDIYHLSEQIGRLLTHHNWTITTAESCTGGGIAQAITAIPGSSAWFECAWVCYSNQAKADLLGVKQQTILQHGAVSTVVVQAMAAGAQKNCHANIAVSVSGIAGPGGGSAHKPVGTVCIGWAWADGSISSACYQFDGGREAIRQQSIAAALRGILAHNPLPLSSASRLIETKKT